MARGMFYTPSAIKILRRYWKDRINLPDTAALSDEISGESDRAVVILIATLLADALEFLLVQRLIIQPDKTQMDHIFRFEGPLGSFSSRIEISYLFGFIDEVTRSQLNDIREMRNACAHTKHPITFSVPALANVAKRLFAPTGYLYLQDDTASEITNTFISEAMVLHSILIEGSREKGIETFKESL